VNLTRSTQWRSLAGYAAAALCLCALLALVDGLAVKFRTRPNELDLLPGSSAKVTGPLPAEVTGLEQLRGESDSGGLRLSFSRVQRGFWLGGNLWRGEIEVRPDAAAGVHTLSLRRLEGDSPQTLGVFRVVVHPDPRSLRLSSKSLIRRHLGWSPFVAAAALVPPSALLFAAVYFLSRRREEFLAEMGQAEIYRCKSGEEGVEVAFGLGTRHGIRAGSTLTLLDEAGQDLGTLEVFQVFPNDALARVSAPRPPKPGYRAAKR